MNKRTTLTILAATAILLVAGSPASPQVWVHFSDSIVDAGGETIKHPGRLLRVIILPTDATGDLVEVCIGYVNNFEQNDIGKVTANVTMTDLDDNVTVIDLGGAVSRGTFGECRQVEPMTTGTILEFDFRFKKFKRMRDNDRFQVAAAVAIDGANPFSRQVGPLSLDDQDAIIEMVKFAGGGKGVALRREGSGWTVDWRIGSQRFELGPTFQTIAQAIAAWLQQI